MGSPELQKRSEYGAHTEIAIRYGGVPRVVSSMSAVVYKCQNTPGCRWTHFIVPYGVLQRKFLCFDSGPLVEKYKLVPRAGSNGEAPARDSFPADYARTIVHAAQRGYLRVLTRHADDALDTGVRIIGNVVSIVEQYTGPNPAVEALVRVLIYVSVLDEYYDEALAAGGFSFRHYNDDKVLTPEISPTPTPYFLHTRITPSDYETAEYANPQFFSEKSVRGAGPSQFSRGNMSEGAAQTTPAEPAKTAPAPSTTAAAVADAMNFALPPVQRVSYVDLANANEEIKGRLEAVTQEFAATKAELEESNKALVAMRVLSATLFAQRVPVEILHPSDQEKFSAARDELTKPDPMSLEQIMGKFSIMSDVERLALYLVTATGKRARNPPAQAFAASAREVAGKRARTSEPVPAAAAAFASQARAPAIDGGVGLDCGV